MGSFSPRSSPSWLLGPGRGEGWFSDLWIPKAEGPSVAPQVPFTAVEFGVKDEHGSSRGRERGRESVSLRGG